MAETSGLYGRQDGIETVRSPEWVTILIAANTNVYPMDNFAVQGLDIADLMMGLAMAGVSGITVCVPSMMVDSMNSWAGDVSIGILAVRPYFRISLVDYAMVRHEPLAVAGPKIILVLDDKGLASLPDIVGTIPGIMDPDEHGRAPMWVLVKKSLIARTLAPAEMLGEMDCTYTDPRQCPSWGSAVSMSLLSRFAALTIVNIVCKTRDILREDEMISVRSLVDEMTVRIFNGLGLRARWRKQ